MNIMSVLNTRGILDGGQAFGMEDLSPPPVRDPATTARAAEFVASLRGHLDDASIEVVPVPTDRVTSQALEALPAPLDADERSVDV